MQGPRVFAPDRARQDNRRSTLHTIIEGDVKLAIPTPSTEIHAAGVPSPARAWYTAGRESSQTNGAASLARTEPRTLHALESTVHTDTVDMDH